MFRSSVPRVPMRKLRLTLGLAFTLLMSALGQTARADLPIEREPINYFAAPVHDPVAKLQERMERGEVKLQYSEKHGYLEAVLQALGIPQESQLLVFSKTSFQRNKITPRTPRALYFNDDTYIGWVQEGEVLEVSTVDPQQGGVYYLLSQEKSETPVFQRQTHECLQCHVSSKTHDVPGHLVRSVYPNRQGFPVFNAGTFTTSHESPFNERFGGWYVTGTHGQARHMGNVFVTNKTHPEQLETDTGTNVTDLAGRVDTSPYLTPHSDIVSLMVLEHQTQMHNLIAAANYQTRLALYQAAGINEALGQPREYMSETTQRRIATPVEELVKYLLFVNEPALTDSVRGTTQFADVFAARGPRDHLGRSLRALDLERRMFRYPCSYLIYSDSFDALPAPALDRVYKRLWEILTGRDQSEAYAKLSTADRRNILAILCETKKGLPDYWKRD